MGIARAIVNPIVHGITNRIVGGGSDNIFAFLDESDTAYVAPLTFLDESDNSYTIPKTFLDESDVSYSL